MADQSYELLFAMLGKMRNDAGVLSHVPASNIFADNAPPVTSPPYIVIGDSDAHREDATCVSAQGIYVTLHVWSWGSGSASGTVQARRICDAIVQAIHDQPLVMTTNRAVTVEHRRTQVFKDADGIKNHGILEFWASAEQN